MDYNDRIAQIRRTIARNQARYDLRWFELCHRVKKAEVNTIYHAVTMKKGR